MVADDINMGRVGMGNKEGMQIERSQKVNGTVSGTTGLIIFPGCHRNLGQALGTIGKPRGNMDKH